MAQKVTVKVVSQRISLEYHGVGTKSSLVAASKMQALLNIGSPGNSTHEATSSGSKSSYSYTLFSGPITEDGVPSDSVKAPLTFMFEPALAKLKGYEEPEAVRSRADFFTSVEAGKRSLIEKFGKRIPNDEIMKLASSLKGKACTIWKHQVITTVTGDTEFRGSHKTREGKYTSSVKSKTVYTLQPLTEAQLEELRAILLAEKQSPTSKLATRVTRGTYTTWDTTASGKVMFREADSSSTLETG